MTLEDTLEAIRAGLDKGAYRNKAAVRSQVVQRVLEDLGWPVYDPDVVRDRDPSDSDDVHVDLSLHAANAGPLCVIGIESPAGEPEVAAAAYRGSRLAEQSLRAGAPLALLTSGAVWNFYSTVPNMEDGDDLDRLAKSIDIGTTPLDEAAAALRRYLLRDNVEAGRSAKHAQDDLKARLERLKTREAMCRAWEYLVEGDVDDLLTDLLIDATRTIAGAKPPKAEAAGFLRSLKPEGRVRSRKPRRASSVRGVTYVLRGKQRTASNAKVAYIDVFKALAEQEPELLSRIEPKLLGRKNRGVAKSRQGVSPTASMQASAASLPGGWWLLTHLSNKQKVKSLRIACEAAGIRFGHESGLAIDLPNA